MSARKYCHVFFVAFIILGTAVSGFSQTYRYLKIWVNNTNSHIDEHTFGVVETEWYVGSIGFPVTKMTSDDGPAPQKCWFERNGKKDNPAPGYWTYRMYDGEIGDTSKYTVDYKSKYATIGFEPYPFSWVLDLGDGNGIAPDSVWIRGLKDDRRVITELKCYGSNDAENWVLLGESDNPSHVENRLHFENAGGGAALSLLGPATSSHLYVGESMKFLWHYNPDSIAGDLELSISPDSGATWLPLPNQPNKDDMVYEWTIPAELNGQQLVSPEVAVSIVEKGNESSRRAIYGINISPQGTKPFVIDNSDNNVEVIGDWLASSASSGFEGSDYIHDQGQNKAGKEVRYKPTIQRAGMYIIYGKWTAHFNRAQAAPYTVQTVGGPVTVTADQRTNGGEWVLLDTFALAQSEGQTVVTISTAGTLDGEIVIADALKFVYIDELSTPVMMSKSHAAPQALSARPRFYSALDARVITAPAGARSVVIFDLRGREITRQSLRLQSGATLKLPAAAQAAGVIGVQFE